MSEQPVKVVDLPAVLKRCLESLVVEQKPAPQEPSADIQAVRELYRDDRDAMAAALLRLRADLAEARRER